MPNQKLFPTRLRLDVYEDVYLNETLVIAEVLRRTKNGELKMEEVESGEKIVDLPSRVREAIYTLLQYFQPARPLLYDEYQEGEYPGDEKRRL